MIYIVLFFLCSLVMASDVNELFLSVARKYGVEGVRRDAFDLYPEMHSSLRDVLNAEQRGQLSRDAVNFFFVLHEPWFKHVYRKQYQQDVERSVGGNVIGESKGGDAIENFNRKCVRFRVPERVLARMSWWDAYKYYFMGGAAALGVGGLVAWLYTRNGASSESKDREVTAETLSGNAQPIPQLPGRVSGGDIELQGRGVIVPELSSPVGSFSNYKGINGVSLASGPASLGLVKQFHGGIRNTSIDPITIKASDINRAALGEGEFVIPRSHLEELRRSAFIMTNEQVIPHDLFFYVQDNAKSFYSDSTLEKFLSEQDLLTGVRGKFNTLPNLTSILQEHMGILGTSICHAQKVHSFIEQELVEGEGRLKLRAGNAADFKPFWMFSIPGVMLWGSSGAITSLANPAQKKSFELIVRNMWRTLLSAACFAGVKVITTPAIGLGLFLNSHGVPASEHPAVARVYFDTLAQELLGGFKGAFSAVYFNPFNFRRELEVSLKENPGSPLAFFGGDVLLLATELSKAGHEVGLVNPSHAAVVWGASDVGHAYLGGSSSAEANFGRYTTMSLGSRRFNDVYTDERRILGE